jgi:hypothetical protein
MSRVNDIYDGWVVREDKILSDKFCTGNGPWAYKYIVAKGIGISRIKATPMEKRSQK